MAANTRPPGRPSLLWRLGDLVARRRGRTLVLTGVLFVLSVVYGSGALSVLSLSRFEAPPDSQAAQVRTVLWEEFGVGAPNFTLLVTAKGGDVDAPEVVEAGRRLTEELAAVPEVSEVYSYWTSGSSPTMRSEDGSQALVLAHLPGDADTTREVLTTLSPEFTRDTAEITVQAGGREEVFRQVGQESSRDFIRAEMLIFPGVLLMLVLLLRRFVAALLPMALGLFAMVGTLAVLRVLALFTDVSSFALNLALVLGLGLGVDYGLIMISRFREERRRTADLRTAVAATVATAGHTVVFSGITVLVSLSALLLFPFAFLRSFAYGGLAVVFFGIVGALVLLPALLAYAGPRVERKRQPAAEGSGFWHATAVRVMRRPFLFGGAVLAVLLLLGSPFLGIRFGPPDDRILPEGTSSRQTQQQLRDNFASEEADVLQVVAGGEGAPPSPQQLREYSAALSELPQVAQVESAEGRFVDGVRVRDTPSRNDYRGAELTWLAVTPLYDALSEDLEGTVEAVRSVEAPFETAVGGYPAELTDYRESVLNRLPLVMGLIFAITFVILFLMSGSLLMPLKATVVNLLSLSVMFGALVWIFQEGNLSGLLGFTATGSLDTTIPILMFCVAYGLSMDYEVFIMSRVKEEYDRTGDNEAAVATGLERVGPLVTAAAVILALTFAAYASSGVVFLKMLGVGTALVIVVDATLVRAILVPAFMRVAGRANWWAPAPLRWVHDRFGISEAASAPGGSPGEEWAGAAVGAGQGAGSGRSPGH